MTFSYTQIAQYLRCPRSYRHRYLDGWREKDTRASLFFGRSFEKALAAFFSGEDSTALFKEWGAHQDAYHEYSHDRIVIHQPRDNMQVKLVRPLSSNNDFVSYIDAVGMLDGKRCLLEWKTTTARYPEEPDGLLALDPQLICYSWISGIPDAAVVAFVRKRIPEIQYLKTTISDQQRRDFSQLVGGTVSQIEAGQFLPHNGIRFPKTGVSVAPSWVCAWAISSSSIPS